MKQLLSRRLSATRYTHLRPLQSIQTQYAITCAYGTRTISEQGTSDLTRRGSIRLEAISTKTTEQRSFAHGVLQTQASAASNKHKQTDWHVQKAALLEKFRGEAWRPRRRLSPDSLDGVRALHAHDPNLYNTAALADRFQISAEAIRRILRSKWRPNEEQQQSRRVRWEARGRTIWSQKAELGIKPPQKWRRMSSPP